MPQGSFRDPSGHIFERNAVLCRQVNVGYKEHYDLFIASGLYKELAESNRLIPHSELNADPAAKGAVYRILNPQRLPFISYPYEWCFSQLKDAALLTLDIQKIALQKGMTLKDASAYNVQYFQGKPIFIDTLSFEKYQEGRPWIAYLQFCQHFLAPLSLMALRDIRLSQLLRVHLDGIPLDLASKLLPRGSWLNFGLLSNIHLHAKAQTSFSNNPDKTDSTSGVSKSGLVAIVEGLAEAIAGLKYSAVGTEWEGYYRKLHYAPKTFDAKNGFVAGAISKLKPKSVVNLGANDGTFSRLSAKDGIPTISIDSDPAAVENNYLLSKKIRDTFMMPLYGDLTNPSGPIGWANSERKSLASRCKAELALALALIHHLSIGNNVPFGRIAEFFQSLGDWLIIEYVPLDDPQVKNMLTRRHGIIHEYSMGRFEQEFSRFYHIHEKYPLPESTRVMYLMARKDIENV